MNYTCKIWSWFSQKLLLSSIWLPSFSVSSSLNSIPSLHELLTNAISPSSRNSNSASSKLESFCPDDARWRDARILVTLPAAAVRPIPMAAALFCVNFDSLKKRWRHGVNKQTILYHFGLYVGPIIGLVGLTNRLAAQTSYEFWIILSGTTWLADVDRTNYVNWVRLGSEQQGSTSVASNNFIWIVDILEYPYLVSFFIIIF